VKARSRTVTVDCDAETARQAGDAVACYAEAAYPPGGSECSQVAREALLDTAARCRGHAGGRLDLPKRQVPLMKVALRWYCEELAGRDAAVADRLARLFD
jgi:hypothetical protein